MNADILFDLGASALHPRTHAVHRPFLTQRRKGAKTQRGSCSILLHGEVPAVERPGTAGSGIRYESWFSKRIRFSSSATAPWCLGVLVVLLGGWICVICGQTGWVNGFVNSSCLCAFVFAMDSEIHFCVFSVSLCLCGYLRFPQPVADDRSIAIAIPIAIAKRSRGRERRPLQRRLPI